jgi:hypothetical protein
MLADGDVLRRARITGVVVLAFLVGASGAGADAIPRSRSVDTAPPASVGAFRTRSGDGKVKLSWTQPVDVGYDHVLVNRKRAGGSSWKKIGVRRDASTVVDSTPSFRVRSSWSFNGQQLGWSQFSVK